MWVRRVAPRVAAVVACAWFVWAPPIPAGAHTVGDIPKSSDYLTRLQTEPEGVAVRVLDGGDRMELRRRGSRTVEVMGYQGEPMLRVSDRGVEENRHSPSLYISRTRTGNTVPPPSAKIGAKPDWVLTTTEPLIRWHDHRVHWMSPLPPPAVLRDPHVQRVVIPQWQVPIVVDGHRATFTGDLTWLPPPSPWPWWIGIGIATLGAAALGWFWWRTSRWVGAALLTVGSAVTAAGAFTTNPGDGIAHALGALVPVVWLVLVWAGAELSSRAPEQGVIASVVGAVGSLALVAWPRIDVYGHSIVNGRWSVPTIQVAEGVVIVGAFTAVAASISSLVRSRPDRSRPAQSGSGRPRTPDSWWNLVRDQGRHQLATGTVDPGADGPDRHVEHPGGVVVGAPDDLGEHEGLPDVGAQRGDQ
jgi:hypothetical protein